MLFRKYEVIVMDLLTKLIIIGLVLILFAIIEKIYSLYPRRKTYNKEKLIWNPLVFINNLR